MKTKSLFISAQEVNAGMLFVSMGMMEIIKRKLPRVAFFRPIIYKENIVDNDISFMIEHYNLDLKYEDAHGFDVAYVENMIASNQTNELINQLILKFKKLEKQYDFVLCEGIRGSFISFNINFDVNMKIAENFGSPYINIINAKKDSGHEVYESVQLEYDAIVSEGCMHFATIVNRLDDEKKAYLENKFKDDTRSVYLLHEVEELSLVSLADVMDSLETKQILFKEEDYTRNVRNIKIAALNLEHFLEHIEEDDLVVVPADRSDIILGLFASLYANTYPNISAIVFPFSMQAHPNIHKLLQGINQINIPILSVPYDTYQTAKKLSNIRSRIRINSRRKIALSLGLFNANVNTADIENKIASANNNMITPMMFRYKLFDMASTNKKKIVLPETNDERVLRAAEVILHRGVADIVLLGNPQEIEATYLRLGLDLSAAEIINPETSVLMNEFVQTFYEMRKAKGLTLDMARDAMLHVNYFATMMVELGYADGMVSGAAHSTGDTIRPALQIIKTKSDALVVSSVFFMCLQTKVLVYGDCAVNQDPDKDVLADIALSSAKTASAFGIEPKVAMLSYSTGESGSGLDVDKVRAATQLVKKLSPTLEVEGPIQYDAAVNKAVAKAKLPNSKVAGEASVLIFPDLNTGNNTYKAVQRSSGAIAIGPILQGLNKPINDLSRGCLVEDIVNTIAITAIQAGQM